MRKDCNKLIRLGVAIMPGSKGYRILLIEYTILPFLFLFKALVFYCLTDNKGLCVKLSLLSLIYIIMIFTVFDILNGAKRYVFFLFFYILISLLMFVDVIYFKYFNSLTSVILLKQFNQLTAISESVSHMMKPAGFLVVADIIPLTFFSVYTNKYRSKNRLSVSKNKRKISLSILLLAIIIILFTKTMDDGFFHREFFAYHIRDIYSVLFTESDSGEVDVDMMIKESVIKTINKEKSLYGAAKDRNVITIQVEGLQYFVINKEYEGQEITPNLNKIIKTDSIYFDRYYQLLGRGNTSDAEFVSHNSLYPAMDGQTYIKYFDNTYYGLPWILKDNGYGTAALHGYKAAFWNRNKAYTYQGFDRYYNGDTDYQIYNPIIGFGINDSEFFAQSIEHIKLLEEPYYAFLITLSSHHPYNMNDMYKKIILNRKHKDTLFGKYIQAINFTDTALGEFIEGLKNEGLYEKAVINIYGDHFGLSLNEKNKNYMTKYLGYEYDFDEMMRVPLIIHIPNSGVSRKISVTGSQLDFLPTILNLIGIENKKGIMLGQDLVNAKEGIVAEQTYMQKGSFIKGDIVFLMSRDGLFKNSKAWNISTRKQVNLNRCREDYEAIIKQINQSDYILRNNVLEKYFSDRGVIDNKKEAAPINYIQPEKYVVSIRGSKDVLDEAVSKGYKFIKLDFGWSANNLIVKNLIKMNIKDLAAWLQGHKDVCIVTDIKSKNTDALRFIKDNYPEMANRVIPQIYNIEEYIPIQGFGYTNIILNLHDSAYSDGELIDFIKRHKVFAVTLPIKKINTGLIEKLKQEYIYIYMQGNYDIIEELEEYSVDGFYIDIIE